MSSLFFSGHGGTVILYIMQYAKVERGLKCPTKGYNQSSKSFGKINSAAITWPKLKITIKYYVLGGV